MLACWWISSDQSADYADYADRCDQVIWRASEIYASTFFTQVRELISRAVLILPVLRNLRNLRIYH
jgi:hypothetical protein